MINESKKRDASPNAHLGLSGMARRIPEAKPTEGKAERIANPNARTGLGVGSAGGAEAHASPPAAEKPAPSTRRASLASIRASKASAAAARSRKKPPITLAKSAAPIVEGAKAEKPKGRGRPSSGGRKEPWKEAGLSKSAYYRQLKEQSE